MNKLKEFTSWSILTSLLTLSIVALPIFAQTAFAAAIESVSYTPSDGQFDNNTYVEVEFDQAVTSQGHNVANCGEYGGADYCYDVSDITFSGNGWDGDPTVAFAYEGEFGILIIFDAPNAIDDLTDVTVSASVIAGAGSWSTTQSDWVIDADRELPNAVMDIDNDGDNDTTLLLTLYNGGDGMTSADSITCPGSGQPIDLQTNPIVTLDYCYDPADITFTIIDGSTSLGTPDALAYFYNGGTQTHDLFAVWDSLNPVSAAQDEDAWEAEVTGFGGIVSPGFTYDMEYVEPEGGGGGDAPEMGTWALVLAVPMLMLVAYSARPQGVRAA
jgi:hypothetical protein